MKNRYCAWIGKALLFLSPLFCGMAGFVILEKQPFLDSLYQCVGMYVLDYGDTPSNLLLEIARWAAPLVTASSVIMAVAAFRTFLVSRIHYLKGDSVAVYGPENEKAALLTQLGGRGIDGKDSFVLAQRYILAGTEEEMISHVALKQMSAQVKFAVRTGEFTPYPNIILRAGVAFPV